MRKVAADVPRSCKDYRRGAMMEKLSLPPSPLSLIPIPFLSRLLNSSLRYPPLFVK